MDFPGLTRLPKRLWERLLVKQDPPWDQAVLPVTLVVKVSKSSQGPSITEPDTHLAEKLEKLKEVAG
jgi:hypothetical protein